MCLGHHHLTTTMATGVSELIETLGPFELVLTLCGAALIAAYSIALFQVSFFPTPALATTSTRRLHNPPKAETKQHELLKMQASLSEHFNDRVCQFLVTKSVEAADQWTCQPTSPYIGRFIDLDDFDENEDACLVQRVVILSLQLVIDKLVQPSQNVESRRSVLQTLCLYQLVLLFCADHFMVQTHHKETENHQAKAICDEEEAVDDSNVANTPLVAWSDDERILERVLAFNNGKLMETLAIVQVKSVCVKSFRGRMIKAQLVKALNSTT